MSSFTDEEISNAAPQAKRLVFEALELCSEDNKGNNKTVEIINNSLELAAALFMMDLVTVGKQNAFKYKMAAVITALFLEEA